MAFEWSSDYPLTIEQLSVIASRYLPITSTPDIQYLGDGCDFDAYRVNEFVLRFPKRSEYVPYYYNEVKLLDKLSEYGHPWIPKYVGLWEDTSLYPYPFGAYPYLAGVTAHNKSFKMSPDDVRSFIEFIRIVHSINESKISEWGVLAGDFVWSVTEQVALIEEDLAWLIANHRSSDVDSLVQLRSTVVTPEPYQGKVLTHTDLLPEHIIVNPQDNKIVGVIDWADSMLGDPAGDFVGLYLWKGRRIAEQIYEGYGKEVGGNFWERVRFNSYRCIIGELRYGLERQRQNYIDGAIKWLRNFEADS